MVNEIVEANKSWRRMHLRIVVEFVEVARASKGVRSWCAMLMSCLHRYLSPNFPQCCMQLRAPMVDAKDVIVSG